VCTGSSNNAGAIAGGVVGALISLLLIGLAFWFGMRRGRTASVIMTLGSDDGGHHPVFREARPSTVGGGSSSADHRPILKEASSTSLGGAGHHPILREIASSGTLSGSGDRTIRREVVSSSPQVHAHGHQASTAGTTMVEYPISISTATQPLSIIKTGGSGRGDPVIPSFSPTAEVLSPDSMHGQQLLSPASEVSGSMVSPRSFSLFSLVC
jgi:hypothetical protein